MAEELRPVLWAYLVIGSVLALVLMHGNWKVAESNRRVAIVMRALKDLPDQAILCFLTVVLIWPALLWLGVKECLDEDRREKAVEETRRRRCPPHAWDPDGERCKWCGAKDWMGG